MGGIAGRDMVDPADAGLGETPAAGRDMVDEADGGEAAAVPAAGRIPVAEADAAEGVAAPAAGRIPVVEAAGTAPVAERIPVEESDAGDIGFGAGLAPAPGALAGDTALGAAEGAVPAPPGATSVVPHCTQNFAPG